MISYKNVKHELHYKDKYGRKRVHTLQNRLQDNCLDYAIYSMLGITLGNSVFSQFTETGTFRESAIGMIMQNMFIKTNTTQTIVDSDMTMDFDYRSLPYVVDGGLTGTLATETVGTGGKSLLVNYAYTFSIPDGDQLTGIGFGKIDAADPAYGTALGYTNYLMSFIDLSAANIESDGLYLQYVRVDEITTNETVMNGDNAHHIPGIYNGELQSITTCYDENGTNDDTTYLVGDLTFTKTDVGVVEVTGFDNFVSAEALYPAENLYPAEDLYPSDYIAHIKSVRFEYLTKYNGIIETYINMKDLDVAYNNTEFKINLKCERGE